MMDFAGFIGKYRVNRPLTEQERIFHLKQAQRCDVEPHYQLSVIKMNSTYLELVDKWYGGKGVLTTIGFVVIAIFVGFFAFSLLGGIWQNLVGGTAADDDAGLLLLSDIGMLLVLVLPVSCVAVWLLRKESFAYIHYPVRFNRITRMVHVW